MLDNNKSYDLLYFLSITLETDEINTIKAKVAEVIKKYSGQITHEEELGKKKLAYNISRARHGHYLFAIFSAPGNAIKQIERELKLMPEIIRHKISLHEEIKIPVRPLAPKPEKTDQPEIKSETLSEKPKKETKVDIQELDRKIDELLADDNL